MANYTATFERVEKKYLLTAQQRAALCAALSDKMAVDRYGEHTIMNIYYDTPSYELIRESLDKPIYKEKLRVRSYGVPKGGDPVFIELKKKYDGVVYKRRISLPLSAAMRFLRTGRQPENVDAQIAAEIQYALNFYGAQPMMCISYDRVAMFGLEDADFRLTLDRDIRYRTENLELSRGSYGTGVLGGGETLLEVKTAGALPIWFTHMLSELAIYPSSFSKYGAAYRALLALSKGGEQVA